MPEVAIAEGGHLLLQDREEIRDLPLDRPGSARCRCGYARAAVTGKGVAPVLECALQELSPDLLEESRVLTVGPEEQRFMHGSLPRCIGARSGPPQGGVKAVGCRAPVASAYR